MISSQNPHGVLKPAKVGANCIVDGDDCSCVCGSESCSFTGQRQQASAGILNYCLLIVWEEYRSTAQQQSSWRILSLKERRHGSRSAHSVLLTRFHVLPSVPRHLASFWVGIAEARALTMMCEIWQCWKEKRARAKFHLGRRESPQVNVHDHVVLCTYFWKSMLMAGNRGRGGQKIGLEGKKAECL